MNSTLLDVIKNTIVGIRNKLPKGVIVKRKRGYQYPKKSLHEKQRFSNTNRTNP